LTVTGPAHNSAGNKQPLPNHYNDRVPTSLDVRDGDLAAAFVEASRKLYSATRMALCQKAARVSRGPVAGVISDVDVGPR
jgi:hypothetical protein